MGGPRRAALAVAAVLAALTGACGGAGGPSRESYARQADRVCAAGNRAIAPFARRIAAAQGGTDPDVVFRELARLTRGAAAASRPYLDRLDSLTTPGEDRDALKAWVADQRRQQSLLRTLAVAFGRRDEAAISRLSQQIDALNTHNDAVARRFGLKACAADAR